MALSTFIKLYSIDMISAGVKFTGVMTKKRGENSMKFNIENGAVLQLYYIHLCSLKKMYLL